MPIFSSLQMFQCRYVAALSCLCRDSVLATSGHSATIWSMVFWNGFLIIIVIIIMMMMIMMMMIMMMMDDFIFVCLNHLHNLRT